MAAASPAVFTAEAEAEASTAGGGGKSVRGKQKLEVTPK
jgi:hypothetical protein